MRLLPFDYAARNLGRSPLRSLLSVGGAALVVVLVLGAAAFVSGMTQSLKVSASKNNVIILGAGSEESVERSEINMRTSTVLAASISGIREQLNVPYVSPEIHMAIPVMTAREQAEGSLGVIRGVTPSAFLVYPQVRIVEGRAPEAGADEIMIGQLVPAKLGVDESTLTVGTEIWIDDRPLTISGLFEAPSTVMDAEIWMPLTDLQVIAQRDSLSCVVVTLDDPDDFADVSAFAAQRLDLEIVAMREADYYAQLSDFFGPVRAMVLVTAGLIAMGGVLGGLNTMYAAFASRVRELGSLQTLGFSRLAIIISLVQESLLTAAVGSLIACTIGLLVFDGVAIRFSMGAFGLVVDGRVMTVSLLAGLALGVIGALPPAWRCLRLPITDALKSG